MLRSRSWFGGLLGRPKNVHSLDHLKYLYNVLSKNQTVSESNRSLLVETLRSIAEILIWGDQNDSTVFDFFLEKNMLSFFLKIMGQKCGSYVCVQLLQTLNILFENIRNETSVYYLLSNNHVNSIIVHKFDFSDEEVMAYYISFLKTLSLKLNTHTINFFYNEHTNDFPLYTEAIKFFNHSESMVRIAVRTLTLNVYRVQDTSMLDFIRNKTAAPYFSNLVWFIGKHVTELDACLRTDTDHRSSGKLADLVAEHLDHLHYIEDILLLKINDLNEVLTDHLLNKLFLPLYIGSLSLRRTQNKSFHVSKVVALFLLSQVFLIITHAPLVQLLAGYLLDSHTEPPDRLDYPLTPPVDLHVSDHDHDHEEGSGTHVGEGSDETGRVLPTLDEATGGTDAHSDSFSQDVTLSSDDTSGTLNASISDEEKSKIIGLSVENEVAEVLAVSLSPRQKRLSLRPCLFAIVHALDITGDDYSALFALCLLYAIAHNSGVGKDRLKGILNPAESGNDYNNAFIDKLVKLTCHACAPDPYIRLVALDMSLKVLRDMALVGSESCTLSDAHVASLAGGREEITSVLRTYYKTEEMFLDLFEDEFNAFSKKPLDVKFLMMDAAVLLPPTATPMTGIEFTKRLPCGEVERARRAIRVYFMVRQLCLDMDVEKEVVSLPLTSPQAWGVQVDNVLDLNNSDLIACTVVYKDGSKIRRFMVIDVSQFILVDPDTRRLGWGVAKLVGFLQDLEVNSDKDDNRCLHITLHRPLSSSVPSREPLLAAKFIFDDHIRCMAANQRLTKGRIKARQKKMHQIAKLLDLPSIHQASPSPLCILRSRPGSGGRTRDLPPSTSAHRYAYGPTPRRDSAPDPSHRLAARSRDLSATRSRDASGSRSRDPSGSRSRDPSASRDVTKNRRRAEGSPLRMPRPRSEEIPLEDIRSRQHRRENILLSGLVQNRQPSPQVTTSNSPAPSPVLMVKEPEGETSFTHDIEEEPAATSETVTDEPKQRKKGQVETV